MFIPAALFLFFKVLNDFCGTKMFKMNFCKIILYLNQLASILASNDQTNLNLPILDKMMALYPFCGFHNG